MRLLCLVFLSLAVASFGQNPVASDEAKPAPAEKSTTTRSSSSTVRRTQVVSHTGKPRKIKMQKMKGVPKFKKPKRF